MDVPSRRRPAFAEMTFARPVWDEYAFYGAVVAGHGIGYVAAFEGWAGRAGGGVELVAVAGDDFGVGADVYEHYRFVFLVDADG